MNIKFGSEIEGSLTHWCDEAIAQTLMDGGFKDQGAHNSLKPHGVWLSWNNGWEEFTDTWLSWREGKVKLQAPIHPRATIVVIDSEEDLAELMTYVGIPPTPEAMRFYRETERFWEALRGQFDGVALTEKGQWRTRMSTFLYGWDCCSICVHDPSHVTFSRPDTPPSSEASK